MYFGLNFKKKLKPQEIIGDLDRICNIHHENYINSFCTSSEKITFNKVKKLQKMQQFISGLSGNVYKEVW